MQIICSWCENFIVEKQPLNDKSKSHSICKKCYQKVVIELKNSVKGYKKGNKGTLKHKNRRGKTKISGEVLGSKDQYIKVKIVLVSSSKLLLEGICRIIEDDNNVKVVAEASKFKEIERCLTEEKPEFLFLDHRTPELDLHGVLNFISEESPNTKVLLFGNRIKDGSISPNVISIHQKTSLSELIQVIKSQGLVKANENENTKITLSASELQRLSQANEKISNSTQIQDNLVVNGGEIENEFENGEEKGVEDKNRRNNRYEEFRLLNIYIKEMAKESLLSPKEEIEISAEIKKYEERAKRISNTCKRVLVTGASGFTGSHLCRYLAAKGYSVRALVRGTSNISDLNKLDLDIAFGDVTKPDSLDVAVKGVETVYHIAALYRQESVPKSLFWEVNVIGTQNMLEAALRAGVQRFVHCSTVGVQGEISNPPADESYPYNPGDTYQRSKMEGEKLALRFFKENDLSGVVVRPAGIYGPGDTRFLKLFKLIKNGKFIMFGSGEVLYHFTYIDDLVYGFELCGEKKEALGQTYNICSDEYVSLNQLVAIIAEALGVSVPKRRLPFWPFWIASFFCEGVCKLLGIEPPIYRRRMDFFRKDRAFDISKSRRELGYEPKIDLKTGMRITADWYRNNNLL